MLQPGFPDRQKQYLRETIGRERPREFSRPPHKTQISDTTVELPRTSKTIWGTQTRTHRVTCYTDGSFDNSTKQASWALLLENDFFNLNWTEFHEDHYLLYRTQILRDHCIHWGGKIHNALSSYEPELKSLANALLIFPSTWDVLWVTDSEASIKTVNGLKDPKLEIYNIQALWQTKRLIQDILSKRTGTLTSKHQYSHRNEHTKESVGNAAADLLADLYMKSTRPWLNLVKPLP